MNGFDDWLQDETAYGSLTQVSKPDEPEFPSSEPCDTENGW